MTGLRDRFGDFVFAKVAGPQGPQDRETIHGAPGPRWFPHGSPITVVHGDAAMFVGGIRAVVLQTLHPVAMQAVSDHSGFRGDLWGRLARTSRFLAVTTFGPEDQAEATVAHIRRIHDRVRGTMPDGTEYVASDPHLLAWVHAAEVDSFLTAFDLYGPVRFDRATQDAYVAQAALVGERLGVIDPPRDVAALKASLESFRPELRSTPQAREAVYDVLWRPDLPLAARPGYAMLRSAAIASLPPWSREMLGLPVRPLRDRTLTRGLGHLSTRAVRWSLTGGQARAREIIAARAHPA